MDERTIWTVIVAGGLLTYLSRLSFISIIPLEKLPALFKRGLRFIPPAVLSAILLPDLLLRDSRLAISLSNHRLLAGMLAALVSWRFKNTWLTIGAGMVALWLLSAL